MWRAGRATPLSGSRNFLEARVKGLSSAPGSTPTGGRMDQWAAKARDKFDKVDTDLSKVNNDWAAYRNQFSNPLVRGALSTGKWGAGVIRDAPRALAFLPNSGTGILGSAGLYGGISLLSGGHLNADPYDRVGQLAFNTMGDPEKVAKEGFMQGLDTGVGTSLDHFNNLGFWDRKNYLMGGGAQQYAQQNALNKDYHTSLANGSVNSTYNPSTGWRVLGGNFDKNFYRDKAYQTVGQHLTKSGFIKRASIWSKGVGLLKKPFSGTVPTTAIPKAGQKASDAIDITGGRGWRGTKNALGSYGIPAAVGGTMLYGGYAGAKSNATQGGLEAGYDTGLQQVGQQMGGLDLMSQLGALFAPQTAAQTGYDRYMQMRQGLVNGTGMGQPPGQQGVSSMYYYPNGEAKY